LQRNLASQGVRLGTLQDLTTATNLGEHVGQGGYRAPQQGGARQQPAFEPPRMTRPEDIASGTSVRVRTAAARGQNQRQWESWA
jgi:hypothetical protein